MPFLKSPLFKFRTVWRISAPLPLVWSHIEHALLYPQWWPGIEHVTLLPESSRALMHSMDASYAVRSPLYTLHYQIVVIELEKDRYILARASGDLEGHGRWTFAEKDGYTEAALDWEVRLTPPFLQAVSHLPGVKSIMRYFHTRLMKDGEKGLQARLAELPDSSDTVTS